MSMGCGVTPEARDSSALPVEFRSSEGSAVSLATLMLTLG